MNRLRVPPIPEAILAAKKTDRLAFDESFTIFDNSSPTPTPTPQKR